ncbi:glucan biosynthesis protein [Rhizobiales bacterium]|nr:glucan biosynthesis protein [Hongsoonwoonella zoysiae]NRG16927.1 glucan biosynthesis protein [Hongsoonwoonella zoysiae]
MDRRAFLANCSAIIGLISAGNVIRVPAVQAIENSSVDGFEFSWEWLVERARERANEAYDPPSSEIPEAIANLSYDQHRAIRFRPQNALWGDGDANFELHAFHPGWLFKTPVRIFEVDGGNARRLMFSAADFEYRHPLDEKAFDGLRLPGVAGFRLHYPLNTTDYRDELIAFLGASYFRALGRGNVYGLSARGLAVDTAAGTDEEFPKFTRFFIEKPETGAREIRIYAELDSPSVAGAYSFVVSPGAETTVDVDARLFLRDDVSRLGIAPLTSMYLFGENDDTGFDDYRPEVHDSDGLAILRDDGKRIWRPLSNPRKLSLSFFGERNVRGFGLLQRDRAFDSYLDTEARYERRPSLWIEPIGDWGAGAVMLAEIPSGREVNDNIAAFWIPQARAEAGAEFTFRYRMTWAGDVEGDAAKARVVRTRTGHGGTAASEIDPDHRKFVVEFAGGGIEKLGVDSPLTAKTEVSGAEIRHQDLQKLEQTGNWRLIVDVEREDTDTPVELRSWLLLENRLVSEIWSYQWNGEV